MNKIYHGDCLDLMKQIPDKSIDFIACDLPYGITARNKWDSIIPFEPLWSEYSRIIKDNGAIALTATMGFASKLIESSPIPFRYDIVWQKNKSTGFLNANRQPLRAHENILLFYKKQPTYNPQKTFGHKPVNSFTKHTSDGDNYGETKQGISGGGQTDRHPTSVLSIDVINNDSKDKFHPTQKPVELMEWLIKSYTDEGETVLDNAIGSGTTAIAAMNTRRNWIGIEMEKEYVDIANNRIVEHLKDL